MTHDNNLKQKNSYILGVGKAGAKNLDFQHQMLKRHSTEQLEKAGLKESTIIWDIGCGNGTMTEIIASRVGDNGQVYAVDISEQQIQIAQQRIKNAGLKNVTFIVSDLYSLSNNDYPKADIVYSRLLLMAPSSILYPKNDYPKIVSLNEQILATIFLSYSLLDIVQAYLKPLEDGMK